MIPLMKALGKQPAVKAPEAVALTTGLHFAITQEQQDTALTDSHFADHFLKQVDSRVTSSNLVGRTNLS
jgi:hypothetical protein